MNQIIAAQTVPTFATLVVVLAAACASETSSHGEVAWVTTESNEQILTPIHDLTLEQTDSVFIVYPTGFDISPSGSFVIADASEGTVKWFDDSGRLTRVVGRKGDGPGEFRLPYFPRFLPDGNLLVVDVGSGTTVSVFDSAGTYLDRHVFRNIRAVGQVEVRNDTTLLLAARSADPEDRSVLFETAMDGTIRRRFLPIRDVTPTGGEDSDYWRGQASPAFALQRDSAFVVLSISDSVWIVDLVSGKSDVRQLTVQQVPRFSKVPQEAKVSQVGMARYFTQLFVAATPVMTDSLVIIPFVQGTPLQGGAVINAIRLGNGTWVSTPDLPHFRGSLGDRLFAISGHPDTLRLVEFSRTRY